MQGLKSLTRLYNIQPYYEGGFITSIGEKSGIYNAQELGKPLYYRVSLRGDLDEIDNEGSSVGTQTLFIVHRSRLLIYNSTPLSFIEEAVEQFWGASIGESALIEIKRYETAMYNINRLVKRSNTPIYNANLIGGTIKGDKHLKQVAETIDSIDYGLEYGDTIVIGDKK